MRRDARCHADRDSGGAIGEKLREGSRQHHWLLVLSVIGLSKIDRVLVKPIEQQRRHRRQPRFRVAHRSGVIAVHITEIALPVDQRIAHGKILCETHQRVIDGLVAMRVVAADDIAHDAGGFLEALARLEPELPHRIHDTPVHGLEAIAHIRQRPVHDGGKRIGEIALLQRFPQIDLMFGLGRRYGLCHVSLLSVFRRSGVNIPAIRLSPCPRRNLLHEPEPGIWQMPLMRREKVPLEEMPG